MTQSSDLMRPRLIWFRPTVFSSKLLRVENDTSRNLLVGEIDYKDGGFVISVKSRTEIDEELQFRAMCKEETERMKLNIADYIAKKLR